MGLLRRIWRHIVVFGLGVLTVWLIVDVVFRITDHRMPWIMAVAVTYGLAAYVWTHDIGTGLRTAHDIESGWVQVNQGLGQVPGMSYGGFKQSGIGREFSLEGMLDSFTQRKNVTVNLDVRR